MNTILRFTNNMKTIKKTNVAKTFLFLNTMFWSFVGLIIGIIIWAGFKEYNIGLLKTLFISCGYFAVLVGMFGGIIYLYRK